MKLCVSTYLGIDGQLVSCIKTSGHAGRHFSVDGELWGDAERFVAPLSAGPGVPTRPRPQDSSPVPSSGS